MTDTKTGGDPGNTHAPLLAAMLNLSAFHREHEKFYASSPRASADMLQGHARTLQALADTWSSAKPSRRDVLSPYEGAEDLNSPVATQLDGVLFMEGEGRPVEIARLVRDLRRFAEDQRVTGDWLAKAMDSSGRSRRCSSTSTAWRTCWANGTASLPTTGRQPGMSSVLGHLLDRAADIIEHVDLTPAALRADLSELGRSIDLFYSAAELISRAADLASETARLVHDNERRWRVFHQRLGSVLAASASNDAGRRCASPWRPTSPLACSSCRWQGLPAR